MPASRVAGSASDLSRADRHAYYAACLLGLRRLDEAGVPPERWRLEEGDGS